MGTSYPAAFDALTNPTGTDPLTAPDHADQHTDLNDAVEAIEVHAGRSGTSFPGSPTSGDRFRRTDRNIDYFYDGTRWLSTGQHELAIPIHSLVDPLSGTNTNHQVIAPYAGIYDLWLESMFASFYITGGTALSASHKWVCALIKAPGAATVATLTISSGAVSTYRTTTPIAIDALLGVTNFVLYITSTKTGTPGPLDLWPMFTYRLVG